MPTNRPVIFEKAAAPGLFGKVRRGRTVKGAEPRAERMGIFEFSVAAHPAVAAARR
jgi:hypothetical protein